jgi:hypothetical protein
MEKIRSSSRSAFPALCLALFCFGAILLTIPFLQPVLFERLSEWAFFGSPPQTWRYALVYELLILFSTLPSGSLIALSFVTKRRSEKTVVKRLRRILIRFGIISLVIVLIKPFLLLSVLHDGLDLVSVSIALTLWQTIPYAVLAIDAYRYCSRLFREASKDPLDIALKWLATLLTTYAIVSTLVLWYLLWLILFLNFQSNILGLWDSISIPLLLVVGAPTIHLWFRKVSKKASQPQVILEPMAHPPVR